MNGSNTFIGTAQEANLILERLGSDYRAIPNTPVAPAMIAILDAIPAYVEKLVDERLKDHKVSQKAK